MSSGTRSPVRPTCLVVDDDPAVRRAIVREISRVCAVSEAGGYLAALECINRSAPAAVVSDRHLGEGPDGLRLLEETTRLAPRALRVLVTGGPIDASVEVGIRSGLIAWLIEKPWPSGAIAASLRSALYPP